MLPGPLPHARLASRAGAMAAPKQSADWARLQRGRIAHRDPAVPPGPRTQATWTAAVVAGLGLRLEGPGTAEAVLVGSPSRPWLFGQSRARRRERWCRQTRAACA